MPQEPATESSQDISSPAAKTISSPIHSNFLRWIISIGVLAVLIAGGAGYYIFGAKSVSQKVYNVGILSGLDFFAETTVGFKAKMAELGYVEGTNITYNLQKTNFEPEKEKAILEKFVDDEVDLILTFPTEVSLAAKEATKGTSIPVIFADAFTEGVDLIYSVRQPGGNITGVRFPGAEISIKRMQYIQEVLPGVKRVWVTYQKDYPPVPPLMEKVRAAAIAAGITLVEVPALSAADVVADLDARAKLKDPGIDALLTVTEPLGVDPTVFAAMSDFAASRGILLAGSAVFPGEEGPLFSNISDPNEAGVLAAALADKIFKGIPAGTIPVTTPESYLKINTLVADKLKIPLSESFLSQADQILR